MMKKKKKKKRLQSVDQESTATDEQENHPDRQKKKTKKKNKSERVQTENEEMRTVSGSLFAGSSEQSEVLTEIPKTKKKKKKKEETDGFCDVESSQELKINGKDRGERRGATALTELHLNKKLERAPTSSRKRKRKRTNSCQSNEHAFAESEKRVTFPSSEQNQLDSRKRTKKKKKQSENEKVEDEEESRGVSGLIPQGRGEQLEQMTDFLKKKKKKAEEDGRLNKKGGGDAQGIARVPDESPSAAFKKSRKRKRKRSVQPDGRELITGERRSSTTDEHVVVENAERATTPVTEQNHQMSPKRKRKRQKKKKKTKENDQVQEGLRPVSGSILSGSGEHSEESMDVPKKKKKTTDDGRFYDSENSRKLKVNRKAQKGGTVLAEMQLNEAVSNDASTLLKKKKKKKKRKQSVESIDQESITVESQTVAEHAFVEDAEGVMPPLSEQTGLKKKKNRAIGKVKDEGLRTVNGSRLPGSGEQSEELTDIPKKKKKKKTTKKNRASGQVEDEESRTVNSPIFPGSGEFSEKLTDIPKKKKKTEDSRCKDAEKSVELKKKGKAGRGGTFLTEMQLNEAVVKDEILRVASTLLKKRKKKKKRNHSVESIDWESITVEPRTTDENVLLEEGVMSPLGEQNVTKRKKNRASGQVEDEKSRTVNGSILPGGDEQSEELADIPKKKKKKKKMKKKMTTTTETEPGSHASSDDSDELHSQSDDNSSSELSPNKRMNSGEDAGSGEHAEELPDIPKKKKKKKVKKKKKKKMTTEKTTMKKTTKEMELCSHTSRDDSDELKSQSDNNSSSERSPDKRMNSWEDAGSEASDGASSLSSELLSDSDEEDLRHIPVSAVPWLVKADSGYYMHNVAKDVPPIHLKSHFYKKERQQLRAQGITVMEGRWSGLEETRLRENLEKFCKVYGIEDHLVLLIPTRFGLNKEVKRFWRITNMLVKLADGIPRTLNTVYLRAVKLFDPWHKLGHFSKEDLKKVLRLKEKHGRKWQYIGDRLKRSSESVRHRVDYYKKGVRKGKWLKFELQKLYDTVMEITAPYEGKVDRFINIPWKKVSDIVSSRCSTMCALKWYQSLSWRFDERKRHTWEAKDYIDLIEMVDAADVNEEFEIDWLGIFEKLSDRVCSKSQLTTFWQKVKMKFAPNYYFMEFSDILDTLVEKAIPNLKEAAAKKVEAEAKRAARQQKKNSKIYFISDSDEEDEDSADEWMM